MLGVGVDEREAAPRPRALAMLSVDRLRDKGRSRINSDYRILVGTVLVPDAFQQLGGNLGTASRSNRQPPQACAHAYTHVHTCARL